MSSSDIIHRRQLLTAVRVDRLCTSRPPDTLRILEETTPAGRLMIRQLVQLGRTTRTLLAVLLVRGVATRALRVRDPPFKLPRFCMYLLFILYCITPSDPVRLF